MREKRINQKSNIFPKVPRLLFIKYVSYSYIFLISPKTIIIIDQLLSYFYPSTTIH